LHGATTSPTSLLHDRLYDRGYEHIDEKFLSLGAAVERVR
jgi:UDP-N-acetylglucosamine enolpyruvyl transferase